MNMWGLIGDDMLEDFSKMPTLGDAIDRRYAKSKANTTKIRRYKKSTSAFKFLCQVNLAELGAQKDCNLRFAKCQI